MNSFFDAIFSPERIYPLHIFTGLLLACLMGIATIVWSLRMRKIGGIAGICFTLFFFFSMLYAIYEMICPTVVSESVAINWSVFVFIFVNTAWLSLFLAGEYSYSDRPLVWRIFIVVFGYGFAVCALLVSLFLSPGTGFVTVTYINSFGWVMHLTYTAFILEGGFAVCALLLFLQFCFRAIRAAPKNKFGSRIRKLLIALSFGLLIDGFLVAVTYNYEYFPMLQEFAFIGPSIIMAITSFFQIIAFVLLFREYRIIYFMPHRAIGIYVVNHSGKVLYDYIFQKRDVSEDSNLLGPAVNAINSIVHQTLSLPKLELIRELRTKSQTFILDMRLSEDVVGLLVVSKSTPLLRKALSTFIDNSIANGISNQTEKDKEIEDRKAKLLSLLKNSFPFISFEE